MENKIKKEDHKNEGKVFELSVQVGNDNGNSEHDIIIDGYQIMQPNVFSKVRKLPMLDEINPKYVADNIEDNLIATVDSPSATLGIYYIGNYALRAGEKVRSIEVGADNNKVRSEIVVINTLAQIAGYAAKKAYLEDPSLCEDIRVAVDMTTGLPIMQYSKENARMFTNKFDTDLDHKVTVHLGNTKANVRIKFNYVKVLPEGITTIHALQNTSDDVRNEIFKDFNEKYKLQVTKNYLKNKKILHVAIGEGTTEYPVTSDIVFDPNFIKGSNNGIGHAIDKSLDEFKSELGLLSYSRQKYSEVLKDTGHKYYPVASDIINGYIEEEAEEILHYAKGEIQKANNEIDIIAVYGGGSIPMKNHLTEKLDAICEKANIKLLYIPEKYSVVIESMGMYAFTCSKIFEALKKKKSS